MEHLKLPAYNAWNKHLIDASDICVHMNLFILDLVYQHNSFDYDKPL